MAVSPHSISDLDLFLKILLPILVLAAIPLNVRGETWDKERHRPSVVGISVISMGLIIALVSGLTSWVDVRVKDDDSHTAESKETAALNQQAEHFKEVMKNQKDAQQTLDQANAVLTTMNKAQDFALNIDLTQLPIDIIEVWIKRKEIEKAMPKEDTERNTFDFTKAPGPFHVDLGSLHEDEKDADPFDPELYFPDYHGPSLMSQRLYGRSAKEHFMSVFSPICRMTLSTGSEPVVPVLRQRSEFLYWNADELTHARLTRDFLILSFAPKTLRAIDLQSERIRLAKVTQQVSGALGGAEPLPLASLGTCLTSLRIRVGSPGFSADTGFFRLSWDYKQSSYEAFALSPPVQLLPTNDQGGRTPSQ